MTKRRVFIAHGGYGQTGGRYVVTDEGGRVLVSNSRTPAFDAARALLAEGATGELEIWRLNGTAPAMCMDIEAAAKLTIVESVTQGLKLRRWSAWGEDDHGSGRPGLECRLPR
jgi:hypothetical protein